MKQMTWTKHDNTTPKNDANKKNELKTYGSKANIYVVTLCKVEINGLN
jgi:hypothetical protein